MGEGGGVWEDVFRPVFAKHTNIAFTPVLDIFFFFRQNQVLDFLKKKSSHPTIKIKWLLPNVIASSLTMLTTLFWNRFDFQEFRMPN